jgi:tRNA dimethylallyltransferase
LVEAELTEPPLLVVCGPTAAGKSALVMALAERYPVTVVSADSRQIYRGFDIGSAKPNRAEQAAVPHVGIDVARPEERWSAWAWARMARAAIAEARAAGRIPVVVGGTGFYIRALAQPLAEVPVLDRARREALDRYLERQPPGTRQRWCARLDPPRAALGPAQWRRAVEVALLTGRPLSDWHSEAGPAEAPAMRYVVVDPGAVLAERIERRVHSMLAAGWLAEVEALAAEVPLTAPAWQATGYGAVLGHVQGVLSREAMVEQVVIRTRQYAKRQRTWFRHQLPPLLVRRVSSMSPDVLATVAEWVHGQDEDSP